MRPLSGFLLSVTAALGATAYDASVFTFDPHRQSQRLNDGKVVGEAAPSLLALRTNSDNGLMLERTDQDTVHALNQYGGKPAPLFGSSSNRQGLGKSLLILEGIGDAVGSALRKDYSDNLAVSSFSPSALGNDPPAFLEAKSGRESSTDGGHCAFKADSSHAESENVKAAWECISHDPIFEALPHQTNKQLLGEIEYAESLASKSQSAASLRISFKPGNALSSETLKALFNGITTSSHDGREITVVLLPNVGTFQQSKRSSQPRNAVQRDDTAAKAGQTKRQQASEAVLSISLPVCHSTNSSCADATGNCSGHGFCDRKYGSKDDGASSDCFACKCQETVEKKEDGTMRTVRWGGAACQQKDLSSAFWLTAGITIMIVTAVGIAMGMLFSVGQEELPGVISAGVGPTRPK